MKNFSGKSKNASLNKGTKKEGKYKGIDAYEDMKSFVPFNNPKRKKR